MAGIRRLPSKDMIFQVIGGEAKETLIRDAKWLSGVIAKSAVIMLGRFSVFVHSVKVTNVETALQNKAMQKPQEDNEIVHPGLRIRQVAWLKEGARKGLLFHD